MTSPRPLRPTPKLDVTRQGSSDYTAQELRSVSRYIQGLAAGGAVTEGDIALATGIGGRTIRAILLDLDGTLLLLGEGSDGALKLCAWADEGDAKTMRLEKAWRTTRERVRRRRAFAQRLPRRQGTLFGEDEAGYSEGEEDEEPPEV